MYYFRHFFLAQKELLSFQVLWFLEASENELQYTFFIFIKPQKHATIPLITGKDT